MALPIRTMAVDSFVPMLRSLSDCLEKAYRQLGHEPDLVNGRLAPDMYTLAQQVQQACYWAKDGVSRLAGHGPAPMDAVGATIAALQAQIAATMTTINSTPAAAFDAADERDCSLEIEGDKVIEMDGVRFLRSWALPHFYFHVVTAYDILRHLGASLGKHDYLSQVGAFIHPKKT